MSNEATPMPLTLLYVPADRPDRMVKALASPADVVIVDLEDAVAPSGKDAARANVMELLGAGGSSAAGGFGAGVGGGAPGRTGRVWVRINHHGTPWHADDVAALAQVAHDVAARVPKVESPEQVRELAAALPGRALHLLIESALGVERAHDLATASKQVASIALGEADLRSDLRVDDDAGLAFVRSRIVVAARAAGLPSPHMSVYANVRDLDGLAQSCRTGRAMGFSGRAAIHPAQLDVIRAEFLPTPEEINRARVVVHRVSDAAAAGVGALVLDDGTFLDVAMVDRARAVLALAQQG